MNLVAHADTALILLVVEAVILEHEFVAKAALFDAISAAAI